jgi:hypothetical protein
VGLGLELSAVALPLLITVFLVLLAPHRFNWNSIVDASQRGDFLYPILIIYADVARRWVFLSPSNPKIRTARRFALAFSLAGCVVYFMAAMVVGAIGFANVSGNGNRPRFIHRHDSGRGDRHNGSGYVQCEHSERP